MKPHRLKMKAFGPFAEETVVDFDAMGNSVYLICGDTGSGKTTIFDGVMYALYGTASGGARSALGTEAFHSDFSKSGERREEMRVELSFSNAGRTYTVFRRMYWGKKGSAQRPSKESALSEEGNVLLTGRGREDVDDVSLKVREILGLDADQFRRIIMLAQGEFQRFLTAKSEERGTILGKLYDNRRHQDLQIRLKAAEALLKKQEEDLIREAQLKLDGLMLPEEEKDEAAANPAMADTAIPAVSAGTAFSTADSAKTDLWENAQEEFSMQENLRFVHVDHPDLIPAIRRILAHMQEECAILRGSIRDQERTARELEVCRTKGESGNRLLEDLDRSRDKLAGLGKERERMEDLRLRLSRALDAEKVLPSEQAMLRAEADHTRVSERILNLERERDQLARSAVDLEKRAALVRQKNTPLCVSFQEQRSCLQNVLHFYKELETGAGELSRKREMLERARENLAKEQKTLEREQKRQKELEQRLQELSGAGELAVSAAKRSLDDLTMHFEALEKLRAGIDREGELAKEEKRLLAILKDAQQEEVRAETAHLNLNKALIRGQAGILARDLGQQLETKDVVICPVCGASHTAADIPSFAQMTGEIPTQESVDAAYEAWNRARASLERAKEAYLAAKGEHEQQTAWIVRRLSELTGVPGREAGAAAISLPCSAEQDGVLERGSGAAASSLEVLIEECREQCLKARRLYERAKADQAAKKRTQIQKEKADEASALAKEALDQAVLALNEAELASERAATSVSNWKAQLEGYPERKEDAQAKIRELTEKTEALTKEMEDAKSAFSGCQKRQAENAGSLAAAFEEKLSRKSAMQDAQRHFSESLREWSFQDAEEYHRALEPEGESIPSGQGYTIAHLQRLAQTLAEWIRSRKAKLERYDREKRDLEAKTLQLEELTKGMERVDLQEVAARIEEAALFLDGMRAKEKELDTKLRTDQRILDRLDELMKKRKVCEDAYAKIVPLADTANGNYAFSRYVLSGFFRRIVEQANVHLDTMTDGEYQLVPTEEGDRRSSVGLGLRILNTLTGLERETASLSGGQMFEASLSLALGLSDIAQMESSSTIRIDSMFIDEGFGSLDSARLDRAMEVLQHLSGGKRQIGIISHVARLDECLPRKIHVIALGRGSTVQVESDV